MARGHIEHVNSLHMKFELDLEYHATYLTRIMTIFNQIQLENHGKERAFSSLLSTWRKNLPVKIFLCSEERFRLKVEWVSTFERRRISANQSDDWKKSLRAEHSVKWKSGLSVQSANIEAGCLSITFAK